MPGKNVNRKYRYLRHVKGQTSIIASKEIFFEMCAVCREHFKKSSEGLRDLGIWPRREKRRWGIVVSHPNGAMATKEELESFSHYALAKKITALWREYDAARTP